MKILIAHNHYQYRGGEDTTFLAETALLREHGHEVIEFIEDNRRITTMPRLAAAVNTVWSFSSYQRLLQLLEKNKPDVAHFHNTFLLISPSAYYACQKTDIPVIQKLGNYRLLCPAATFNRQGSICEVCLGKSIPWPSVLHACYRNSRTQSLVVSLMLSVHNYLKTWQKQVDLYIARTHFSKQKFVQGGLPAEKIIIQPGFVYQDPGIGRAKKDFVLFAGRLSPEKGARTLLQAWRRLEPGKIPLKIVGDGPLIGEIRRLAHSMRHIEVLGRRPQKDVFRLMKNARFLIFPSECYEHFPLAIAEAFACGTPVIASRLGAISEIVENTHTGLFFTPGDDEDLADKVEWAWTHPERMKEMGQEARQVFEKRYTAEQHYVRLMQIYQKAIGQHETQPGKHFRH